MSELFTQTGQPTLRIDQTYTADGQIATQTRYSDAAGQNVVATSDYTYDFNGNETQIIHKSPTGAVLAEYDYSYDEAGDLLSETDNGVTTNYQYDATGQLVGYGNVTQSYDANGNRNGQGYLVGPDNQLLSDGTWNYTCDNEGNESSKTNIATGMKWTYGYDNINELVSAVETDANGNVEVEADYKYDVFGNRLEKDVWTPASGWAVTKFAYDAWNPNVPSGTGNENWNVWAELDANNELLARYMRGDHLDQIFAEEGPGGAVAWFLTDRQNSTRVLVDNSGNVLDEIDYDAFGEITERTNAAEQPLYLYTGREFDVETGLEYNRARYYDSGIGRWISEDPTQFAAGDSNLYRYANNAPLEGSDPSGLAEEPASPEPWRLKANWKDRSGALVMTSQGVVINFGRINAKEFERISDLLWESLKSFKMFNGDNTKKNIATVKLYKSPDGDVYAGFTTVDSLKNLGQRVAGSGDGPNGEVYVRLFYDKNSKTVTAVTLGNHMIVGVRQWELRAYTATNASKGISRGDMVIRVTTTAWEQRNGVLTNAGFWTLGSKDMSDVWKNYLEAILRDILSKTKELGITDYVEFPMREMRPDAPNPFSRKIPDKKYRQP